MLGTLDFTVSGHWAPSVFLRAQPCFSPSYWNRASLDSQGEIVPIEPPDPELTQIRCSGDEKKSVRSRQQLLLDIAAFIRHASIGCYGTSLTVVEQKPKILRRS